MEHPYRDQVIEKAEPQTRGSREELALGLVLFFIGVAGIAIGLLSSRALELTLGAIFAVLGLRTTFGALRAER